MKHLNPSLRIGTWRHDQILLAWNNAAAETGYDEGCFRRDCCGTWIRFSEFGRGKGSEHGWYIDYILPAYLGGAGDPQNLRPMHWSNNPYRRSN